MLAWLEQYGYLSYGKQQQWLQEMEQVEVGLRTLAATSARFAAAVAAPVQALRRWVFEQPHLHADESPWLVGGIKE